MEDIQVYYGSSHRKILLQELVEDLKWNWPRGIFFNETQAGANALAGVNTSRPTTTTPSSATANGKVLLTSNCGH